MRAIESLPSTLDRAGLFVVVKRLQVRAIEPLPSTLDRAGLFVCF